MKKLLNVTASFVILAGLAAWETPARADPNEHHDDHHDIHGAGHQHRHWHKGGQIAREDWDRGRPVDYHAHHLHEPPPGYEWRQIGGNFVLAAVATGLVASIIAAGH